MTFFLLPARLSRLLPDATDRLDAVADPLNVRGVGEAADAGVQVAPLADDQRGAVHALHRVRDRTVASDVTLPGSQEGHVRGGARQLCTIEVGEQYRTSLW